jgi:uncharacterized protein
VQPLAILRGPILERVAERLAVALTANSSRTDPEMSDLKSAAYDTECQPGSAGAFDKKQDQASASAAPIESIAPSAPIATVPSPCIDICKIDSNTDWCIGCLRTRDEIRGWKHLSDELRIVLIDELSRRKLTLTAEKAATL